VQVTLDQQRDLYRRVASTGATVFLLMSQLSAVNHMYQFSLPAFSALFKANLARHGQRPNSAAKRLSHSNNVGDGSDEKTAARVDQLCGDLTLAVFDYVTRYIA